MYGIFASRCSTALDGLRKRQRRFAQMRSCNISRRVALRCVALRCVVLCCAANFPTPMQEVENRLLRCQRHRVVATVDSMRTTSLSGASSDISRKTRLAWVCFFFSFLLSLDYSRLVGVESRPCSCTLDWTISLALAAIPKATVCQRGGYIAENTLVSEIAEPW